MALCWKSNALVLVIFFFFELSFYSIQAERLKKNLTISAVLLIRFRRPQWLSWMRRPTGDQEVAGSTPAEVGNILSWRLIMKYFLRSFSPFH